MTTHFTSHFRRPIGVLVGLSLLASLLVAVPGPTKAQAGPAPDYLASFEACPEDIIPDAGFSDVLARNDNAGDIDCIAYYGITHGTSLTTYAPKDPVIREHMALFLIRLANLVGIRVPSPGSTTRFTDIAHLTTESQDAINQLALLRITIGTNRAGTTYTPDRDVTRGEMALFLQRLMDLMDPVADGRDIYGYIPDDVDRNAGDFEVESPFNDLDDVSVTVYDAVTQLYELGVASGYEGSVRFYRPSEDMFRAAMAEFMAAILDHSNLRPEGVLVQMSPTEGLDDFDIVTMISVRDASFVPREDEPVDWFYTDDPDGDGGLLSNGTCDDDLIIKGDCEWDEDDDDTTDRYGNVFEEFRATAGETMTFYAWIGRRNGDVFDDDTVAFALAESKSNKGADSIRVQWEERVVLPNATQIEGAYLVDLDRHSSLEFTIQLQDEDENDLELEGVEIEVKVESDDIVVIANQEISGKPAPDYEELRGDDDDSTTVITDRDGEATFELDAPRKDERLDEVIFSGVDCCGSETVQIAWSTGDSVLVEAKPTFDSYQARSENNIRFSVAYDLYDQYGGAIRGPAASQTGREGTTLKAFLEYKLYSIDNLSNGIVTGPIPSTGTEGSDAIAMKISSGRVTHTVVVTIPSNGTEQKRYLLLLMPIIFTESSDDGDGLRDPREIEYVSPEEVVWIVKNAVHANDLPASCDLTNGPTPGEYSAVDVNVADREFRTCFTLWRYDSNDRFFSDGEEISADEFGERLKDAALTDISITLYSTRSSNSTIFKLP